MKFEIPEQPIGIKDCSNFKQRFEYIKNYGFIYLSWNWLNPLIEYLKDKKCLEVMSGTGALSYVLKENEIDVITTDNMSWHKKDEFTTWEKVLYTETENIDAIEAIKKYGKNVDFVIMSWAYMDDTAYRVIKELYNVNKNAVVIYIGEGWGGCTADDNFFTTFEEIDDISIRKINREYFKAQWYGLHDNIIIGRYNPSKELVESA